jgi:hypothetical protein
MAKWEKTKMFVAGVVFAILMMFLLGAHNTNEVGRYQITGSSGALFAVIDTSTGSVQTFDTRVTSTFQYR